MCPNAVRLSRLAFSPLKQQRGFLIPLALFIVVVMGLLALALARTTTQTSLASAQEFLSLQAFYAAESGAQMGMQRLFFNNDTRAAVDAACVGWSDTLTFPGVQGLANCSALVSCSPASTTLTSFYTITSNGFCGSGALGAERRIRVGSFMDEQ